ncbi:phosphate-binding protein PstS [Salinibacterium xinjiangense]|uniref:Phosphate-binding protein n=1 Tax=Salinibacterium xinjiangense TaxID=386302 RepID=A0A2C8YEF1_9MICO|nr:phosphate ABC transporter substrate-binding protein PstS [Salinibacterium xinjiangense]GGK96659.1 phosphate-binding protein PstS [Salinibacterium xinjiangense]SOE48644.1 phosphate ABC transporter substrate-binding protein, PhoT family [Salinibacterium xinjiangense]
MNSVLSRYKRLASIGAIAVAGTILLSSCAANEAGTTDPSAAASDLAGTIDGSGASSQGSAQEAWVAAFQTENPDVTINYDPSGSGAGREAFISGGVSFAGTDSALKQDEIDGGFAACVPDTGYIQVPAYISPIAVIFNVEGVDALNLDAPTIAGIFKGTITTWNDPAIAALNADATLPSAPITAVHRSDDSGTTKNFTDYLNKVAPEIWDAPAADPFPYQVGEAAQGTSGVVDAVTNGTNTIGYADASKAGDLGVAAIKVGDEFVDYSPEAAAAVVAGSPAGDTASDTDLVISLDRKTTDPTHYPLVLVSYIITCTEFVDAEVAPVVKAYVQYITSDAGQSEAASSAGAAPLSTDLSAKVATALESIK